MSEAQTAAQRYAIAAKEFREQLIKEVQGTEFEGSRSCDECIKFFKEPFLRNYEGQRPPLQQVIVIMGWAASSNRPNLLKAAKALKDVFV